MKNHILRFIFLILFMNLYAYISSGIYIVDTGNNRIQKFTTNNEFSIAWGQYGREPGMFMSPSSVAISRTGNYIYIVDTANNRIQKFTSSGEFILLWGGPEYGTINGMFASPSSITLNFENGQDFVYVADTGNNRIQKFDANGNWIENWSGFNNPQGITSDYYFNYLYIADTGNNKIKKFDIRGNLIMEWGGSGIAEGKFRYPRDLAVDKYNKVYVADGLNYRIQKFTSDGIFELSWGSKGGGDGQFSDHFGVSVDIDCNVYVADAGNNRIQKFNDRGEWLGNIGSITQGTGAGEFYYPQGIEVYIERPLIYPTEIINMPIPEEITPTPVWSIVPSETISNTPMPTSEELKEENPDEIKITPTLTLTDTPVETETPIITPTQTDNQCVLYYSIEYGNKKYYSHKFKITKIKLIKFYMNIFKEKISLYKNKEGGYIYEFTMFNLKILVYDMLGCYLDEIESLISMKPWFRKVYFYSWFYKKCMIKHQYNFHKCSKIETEDIEKLILKTAGLDNAISKEPGVAEPLEETNTFNYPNPFRKKTTIRFSLNYPKDVKVLISNIAGNIVWQKNITSYETRPGINYLEWTGINDAGFTVSNGTYIYRIITEDKTVSKKLVILK